MLFIPLYVAAQSTSIREPVGPKVKNDFDTKKWRKAGVVFHGESTLYGHLNFTSGKMTLYVGLSRIKKIIFKSQVASIKFMEWKAQKRGRMYYFYPVVTFIKMNNGETYVCYGVIDQFLSFIFRDYNNRITVYSHYIDYKKGTLWLNKKGPFNRKRFKAPIAGVVKEINFQKEQKGDLQNIFKRLLR